MSSRRGSQRRRPHVKLATPYGLRVRPGQRRPGRQWLGGRRRRKSARRPRRSRPAWAAAASGGGTFAACSAWVIFSSKSRQATSDSTGQKLHAVSNGAAVRIDDQRFEAHVRGRAIEGDGRRVGTQREDAQVLDERVDRQALVAAAARSSKGRAVASELSSDADAGTMGRSVSGTRMP